MRPSDEDKISITSMSCCRFNLHLILVMNPRFVAACWLFVVGAQYLAIAINSLPDLILKPDELVYASAPLRTRNVLENTEPVKKHDHFLPVRGCMNLRSLFVVAGIVGVCMFLLVHTYGVQEEHNAEGEKTPT